LEDGKFSLISRTEVRAVKYPMRGLTFHNDAARYDSSSAGSRRVKKKKKKKKATVLVLGYDAMMC
jgi:hypothetical protein